ncbi:hypothetical protein Q2T41_01810 [Maribacter confluentis]|uniref:Uncharacterized protein n=1 Tax=Maribacter confluentis TaxID=1656093 RepID=A0ABT8RKA3_9FLAO|nr:hypothetical protein [Maribacter confluentis]MDO1511399.1 hypothetical protein [Maribacter confluentis]
MDKKIWVLLIFILGSLLLRPKTIICAIEAIRVVQDEQGNHHCLQQESTTVARLYNVLP